MKTLYRHITVELLAVLAVVFAILIFVGVGFRFTGYLQEAATGRFDASVLWSLIGLRLPEFVQLVLPFSLFLAIVVTLGRVHADQEYVVLVSGGASPLRLIGWIATLVVPCAVVVGLLSLLVTPHSSRAFVQLIADQAISSEIAAIVPGEFRNFSKGTRTIYAEKIDRESRTLGGLFFAETKNDKTTTVTAEQAQIHVGADPAERILVLMNGKRFEGTPGQRDYRVVGFDELSLRLDLDAPLRVALNIETRPTNELDINNVEDAQELHWRWSLPVMTLVSGLFAFAISRTRPRSGRFGQIVPGILIFVSYYVLLVLAQHAMAESEILAKLGLWHVHLLVAVTASYWTYRQSRPA